MLSWVYLLQVTQLHSDFVTNSYGESWDSSCEQIMSPSPEVPVKETTNPQLEMLGPLCAQTNKRDSVVKHNEHSNNNNCASLNNSHKNGHRNHRNKIFKKNIFRSIDRSTFVSYGTHAMNFSVSLEIFMHQGCRMQKYM